jgi:hypothetical protein
MKCDATTTTTAIATCSPIIATGDEVTQHRCYEDAAKHRGKGPGTRVKSGYQADRRDNTGGGPDEQAGTRAVIAEKVHVSQLARSTPSSRYVTRNGQ